jgi:hypothetical protein
MESNATPKDMGGARTLRLAFCLLVLALAVFQFSENTADPDLWGHVLFGQHLIKTGVLEQTDPFSWTAGGIPWVNHEVLSEVALGGAHLLGGGTAVLLLKILIGLLAFSIALRTGADGLPWPQRAFAWMFGALAVVEISFGFAARPQIFTALGLAAQLWLLRKVHSGETKWAFALPILFFLWINTHGGALAGIVLLWLTVGATTVQFIAVRKSLFSKWLDGVARPEVLRALWISSVLSTVAMFFNPWGVGLIRWLIGSVLWLRPEIEEWNPATLSWDHGAFFGVAALTIVSFLFSRRPRSLWEVAVCGAVLVLAFRSVRHTPLFCIAALSFVPRHLADVLSRLAPHVADRLEPFKRPAMQRALAVFLLLLSAGVLWAGTKLHKENPWTIEVPRKQYPVAAVKFIQDHNLRGNMLVFFDWGEMALWELPQCPPSIDGRLDTCYSRTLISEHWKFYNAEPFDPKVLDIAKGDLALLPTALVGARELAKQPGWSAVYVDDVAVLLVREPKRFPKLAASKFPIQGDDVAAFGRAPFPEQNPRLQVK